MDRAALYALAAVLLGACGEDTEGDDWPNILTGLSGVILLIIVIWLLWRAAKKRG